MTPLPTLRQLQFFVALSRRQSFSRAAEDSLVSQSTLSAAIKELEHILGADVVDRSSRGFALTPVGEQLVPRAEELLARAEDLVRIADSEDTLAGVIRLGVIPTIGPFILPEAMPLFDTSYPELSLYLREDLTSPLIDRLRAGLIDMVLMAFPYEADGVSTLTFAEDPFYFTCLPSHPLAKRKKLAVDDLAAEELLLLEDGHCLRDHALSACQLQSRHVANMFGGTSLFTLTQMARSGLGTTLLPQLAVTQGLASAAGLQTVPFRQSKSDPGPRRQLGLAWRKGSGLTKQAELMAEVFSSVIGEAG